MLKELLILFITLISLGQAFGQQNQWPISAKHKEKLERMKTEGKKQKLLEQYLRQDSVKNSKQLRDSIKTTLLDIAKDSLKNHVDVPRGLAVDSTTKTKAKSIIGEVLNDSLSNYVDIPDITLDSTTSDQLKSELRSAGKERLGKELGTDLPDIELDSTMAVRLADEAEKKAMEELKKRADVSALEDIPSDSELGQLTDYKNRLEQTQKELQEGLAKQKLKEKMVSSAKNFIQKNAGQINEVQSKMGELKQKYNYVPNSNDLSSAQKRTSLQGESIWKRLVIGGNFNVTKTNPLRVDLSPVIGYKINKLFEVGLTGVYRNQFKADNSGVSQPGEEVYGYSVFADHLVFKNFFGHLEGERLRTNLGTLENASKTWKHALLMGIGRKFSMAKWFEMQALVLYNPLHDNTDGIYSSPVVFKTGIRVKK